MAEKEDATIKQAFLQNCWDGNKEKVQACLTLEVDVDHIGKAWNEPWTNPSSSGLAKAAISGHIEVVDLLLTAPKIDINQTSEYVRTCLHDTCWQPHNLSGIIVKLCSDPRIKLNERDSLGKTPAFKTVENGHIENLRALKYVPGVNWNIKDNEGDSPLMLAVKEEKAEKITELVKIIDIDLNATNKSGQTLEQVAR